MDWELELFGKHLCIQEAEDGRLEKIGEDAEI